VCVLCAYECKRGHTGQRSSSHSFQAFWEKQWKALDEIACSCLFTSIRQHETQGTYLKPMLPEKVQLVGLLRVVFEEGKGERLSISEERAVCLRARVRECICASSVCKHGNVCIAWVCVHIYR